MIDRAEIANLRTEPLTKKRLAYFFDVGREIVPELLATLDAEQIGTLYRVRLADMPPKYWVEAKLVDPSA